MILIRLFLSFALVGLLTIGGGYSSLALIKEQAVEINGWLTMTEFSDLITISEITPANRHQFRHSWAPSGRKRGAVAATLGL